MITGSISRLSLANHSDSGVLPGGAFIAQPRWMPAKRILGGGRTHGVSFWPFLDFSSWWWLVSSVFLTRTSCSKIIDTNGYYGACPGGWFRSVCFFWHNRCILTNDLSSSWPHTAVLGTLHERTWIWMEPDLCLILALPLLAGGRGQTNFVSLLLLL